MRNALFAIAFISYHVSVAWSVSGRVIDGKTQRGIAYVNVGIVLKGIGTVTDESGAFLLHIPEQISEDTLVFSSIGYGTTRQIIQKDVRQYDWTISLEEEIIELEEVVVRTSRIKPLRLGSRTTSKFLMSSLSSGDLGGEVGTKIHIKKNSVYLDSLHFYLVQNSWDTVLLRLNLYPTAGKFPKKSLLSKNVVVRITGKKKGWVNVDISSFNIQLNTPVIACLELVGHSKQKGSVIFSQAPPYTGPMYYRNKSMDVVKRFRGGPMGIYFTAYEMNQN